MIVKSLFQETLNSDSEDAFVFYWAGHGFTDAGGDKYIITYNTNQKEIEIISLAEIKGLLSYHKGKTYVILDACFTKMDVDVENLTEKLDSLPLTGSENGPAILFSSSQGERAIESKLLRSGLATHILLDYLKGKNPQKGIDFEDMYNHILKQTPIIANNRYNLKQTPAIGESVSDTQ